MRGPPHAARGGTRIASVANVTIVLTLMLICFGQAGSLSDDSIIAIGFVAFLLMIPALVLPQVVRIFQRIMTMRAFRLRPKMRRTESGTVLNTGAHAKRHEASGFGERVEHYVETIEDEYEHEMTMNRSMMENSIKEMLNAGTSSRGGS